MARGKKYDNKTVIAVMSNYLLTNSFTETARQLELPISTVESIYKSNKDKPEFGRVREKIEDKFITKATQLIEKSMNLIEQKIDEAVIDDNARKAIRLSELASITNTLYDKRALAQGESTENSALTIKINGEIKEWAK